MTDEVDKDSEQFVSALVQANKGLAEKTEKEVSAFNEQVSSRLQEEKMIRTLAKNNMVGVGENSEIIANEVKNIADKSQPDL